MPSHRSAQSTESRCSRGTKSFRCRVCTGIHPLRICSRFLRLNAERRLRAVLINKYCPKCLAHQHSEGTCRSNCGCQVCGSDHHTLLHLYRMKERRQRSPTPPQAAEMPRLSTVLAHTSTAILPTANLRFDVGSKKFDVRVMVDACSGVSRIDNSLAEAMNLPILGVGNERVCKASLIPINAETPRMEVVFSVEDQLRIRTPARELSDTVRTQFANIVLADPSFYRPTGISVVLGADVYPNLIQPGLLPSPSGRLVAQNTVLGWMLSGTCAQ